MKLPLFNRLKKRQHRELALLQDEITDIVYRISDEAVLHGGTAIWRCYNGLRFSEDLDFYLIPDDRFKESLVHELNSRGLTISKFKKTDNSVFSKIVNNGVEARLEIALRTPKEFEPKAFEKTDGSFFDVFTLPAAGLMEEKMNAYSNRRIIRDFYDVYFLSNLIEPENFPSKKLKEFLGNLPSPVDEKNLKALVFSGAVPSFGQMLSVLRGKL